MTPGERKQFSQQLERARIGSEMAAIRKLLDRLPAHHVLERSSLMSRLENLKEQLSDIELAPLRKRVEELEAR